MLKNLKDRRIDWRYFAILKRHIRKNGDKRNIPLINIFMLDNLCMKDFGENLSFLMARDKVNTTQLARKLNLPIKTVGEWVGVNARTPRDLNVLPQLAQIFNVSLKFLICGEEEDPIAEMLQKTTTIYVGTHKITIEKIESG